LALDKFVTITYLLRHLPTYLQPWTHTGLWHDAVKIYEHTHVWLPDAELTLKIVQASK